MKQGADVHAKDNIGYTALRHGIAFGYITVAQLLLDYGSDINATDNWNDSILVWAIRSPINKLKLATFVLSKGGKPDDKAYKYAKELNNEEGENIIRMLDEFNIR